jgi:hypothetical protein
VNGPADANDVLCEPDFLPANLPTTSSGRYRVYCGLESLAQQARILRCGHALSVLWILPAVDRPI